MAYIPTKKCSVHGCERRQRARGLCAKHWQRFRKHGDPNVSLINRSPLLGDRLWSRVPVLADDDCWEWQGSCVTSGHGRLWFRGQALSAHRVAWELTHGPIPKGLLILHKCDNPPCCNPAHLFLGTYQDNNRDRENKGRGKQPFGERSPLAKVTESDVRFIRQSVKSHTELASKFNVTKQAIAAIRKRKTWQHVE